MTDNDRPTSSDQLDRTADAGPTTDLPSADAEPTGPPLAHHEPAGAHGTSADHVRDMEGIGGHVDEHMSDDHGHGEARLGPIDWGAWGYAVLGVIAGLIVVGAFWLALG